MNISELKKIIEKNENGIVAEFDGLVEFKVEKMNSLKENFDIEGSMEFDEKNTLIYSLNFYNVDKDCEYDGIIGKIFNPSEEDIINLFNADFIEL